MDWYLFPHLNIRRLCMLSLKLIGKHGFPSVSGVPELRETGRNITNSFPASLSQSMGDTDGAVQAYEQALRHDAWSVRAMHGIADILHDRDQFALAVDYLRTITKVDPTNGEVWSQLGEST
jgi:Flp pilus assembly protein TadD